MAALHDMPDPVLQTYRTDASYRAHHPAQRWPASWHRAVCARAVQEVPGVVLVYAPDPDRFLPLRGHDSSYGARPTRVALLDSETPAPPSRPGYWWEYSLDAARMADIGEDHAIT